MSKTQSYLQQQICFIFHQASLHKWYNWSVWVALDIFLVQISCLSSISAQPVLTEEQSQIREDLDADADQLYELGEQQYSEGRFQEATETYKRALVLRRRLFQNFRDPSDRFVEGRILNEIGRAYIEFASNDLALNYYEEALLIFRENGEREWEAKVLNNIGIVYATQGSYLIALNYFQEAVSIFRDIDDALETGNILNNTGFVYYNLGNLPKALEFYQQALEFRRKASDYIGEAKTLLNIGYTYTELGQYEQAFSFYSQALRVLEGLDSHETLSAQSLTLRASVLRNIGVNYVLQEKYDQAINAYQEGLELIGNTSNYAEESYLLNNLGWAYGYSGQYSEAISALEQSLAIIQELGDRMSENTVLNGLGQIYQALGQYTTALNYYQQALTIDNAIGERANEALTLTNIAATYQAQQQPEIAIAFYKRSVNVTETIRQDLQSLPIEQQQSYTNTIADRYRRLADLLLSQGRILEAQQVLELLKIEELREFTNTRARVTTNGIAYTATEQAIIDAYNNLIAFGQQIDTCEQSQCNQLNTLLNQRDELTQEFRQTLQALTADIQQRRIQDRAFLDPEDFTRSAIDITNAEPGTVLIYPFVLEDKLWLLWATSGGVVNSIEISVSQQQLGETVLRFRQLLSTPNSQIEEVQATAKQLYDWLIAPLQPQLQAGEIHHLVFSLDRVTRYIPMAALFDGEHYLIENYTVSTVLSNDLTDLSDRTPFNPDQTSVLAMGLSDAVANFNPLPHVPSELDAIVRGENHPQGVYPGQIFLNRAFDRTTLRNNVSRYPILHVATHGVFVPGRQDESYLLLGTGEQLKIPELQNMQQVFSQVRMVVLSACETALGEPDQDGIEIAGMAYYFLNSGANTVMASLWSVDDASTTELMQQFYQTLAAGTIQTPITRAEALQQAQLRLLHSGSSNRIDAGTRSIVGWQDAPERDTDRIEPGFSHPYYWAPFILIGNGL